MNTTVFIPSKSSDNSKLISTQIKYSYDFKPWCICYRLYLLKNTFQYSTSEYQPICYTAIKKEKDNEDSTKDKIKNWFCVSYSGCSITDSLEAIITPGNSNYSNMVKLENIIHIHMQSIETTDVDSFLNICNYCVVPNDTTILSRFNFWFSNLFLVSLTLDLSLSDYVLETCILPNSKCNSMYMLWAGHPKDESRTTHCVEEFLRHFNQQFYTPNPYIHWLNKKDIGGNPVSELLEANIVVSKFEISKL
ncbi:hypothetical protein AGLY_016200 [Aphis glycines]|uniref:Uncharacterized protein n=1 Tax=Aphis glycines TaxID=307491 RepID=A0A6G0SZS1_APHGL|nr:hypothetical protein AGLY_016200 [Aphis glycines]